MRYTLTDKAIAILLSLVLLAGIASASAPISPLNDGTQVDVANSTGTAENDNPNGNQPGDNTGNENGDDDNNDGGGDDGDGGDNVGGGDGNNDDGGNTDGIGNDNDVDDVDNEGGNIDGGGNEGGGDTPEVEAGEDFEDIVLDEEAEDFEGVVPFDVGLLSESVTVTFKWTGADDFIASVSVQGDYSVSSSEDMETGETVYTFTAQVGDTVTFVANPGDGGVQSWGISGGGWLSDPGTGLTASVTLEAAITVTVAFHRPFVNLDFGTNMTGVTATANNSPLSVPRPWSTQSGNTIALDATADAAKPPEGKFVLWHLAYGSVTEEVIQSATGQNTASFRMPAHDTTVSREFLDGRVVTFTALEGTSAGTSLTPPNTTYTWSGETGTKDLGSHSGTVPDRADVTFTAPPPTTSGFRVYEYEWKVTKAGDSAVTTINNSNTHTITGIDADYTVEVKLVPGYAVKWDIDRGGSLVVTGEYGGTSLGTLTYANDEGVIVRGGTTVALTASPPGGTPAFSVFAYQWQVGSGDINEKLHTAIDPHKFSHIVNADTELNVKLVRGHNLTFGSTGSIVGTVTAGYSTATTGITSGTFLREDSSVTFEAEPPTGVEVLAHTWYVNGALQNGESGATFTIGALSDVSPITDTIDVRVGFAQGYNVTFGLADGSSGMGTVSAVATPNGGSSADFEGGIVEENTVVVFTATPTPVANDGDPVYRFKGWSVASSSSYTIEGNELTLTVTDSAAVRAEFEEVTLTLAPDEVTVKGHGAGYIFAGSTDGPGSTITVDGNATGGIEFSTNSGSSWESGGITVVGGLTLSASGGTITVESGSPLSSAANAGSPYTVSVRREGVTATLTITVELPYLEIVSPSPAEIEIRNENITAGVTVVVETNAATTSDYQGKISIPGLDTLPGDLKATITGESISGSSNNRDGDLRLTILIKGDRQSVEDAVKDFTQILPVRHESGVSDSLTIKLNLTPPPRINSIVFNGTATAAKNPDDFDFEHVSVHGSLGTFDNNPAASSVYAVFDVTGASLLGDEAEKENEEQVKDSLQLADSVPDWINVEEVDVVVNSNTSATVTVKMVVTANKDGDAYSETPRDTRVTNTPITLTTNLPDPPDPLHPGHANIKGELDVHQYGKIKLTPNSYAITNADAAALAELGTSIPITVGGSGIITQDDGGTTKRLPENMVVVTIGENSLAIAAYRPADPKDDINGETYTVTVTRDGLTATLTLTVTLTSLDRPTVEWPKGFEAIYGDTVGNRSDGISLADYTGDLTLPIGQEMAPGVGYAYFSNNGQDDRVRGTFTWEASGDFVGDVGKQTHQMIFTPDEYTKFATMFSGDKVTIDVSKATPDVTWPGGLSATFGQTLNDVKLFDADGTGLPDLPLGSGVGYATFTLTRADGSRMRVPGTFAWSDTSALVGDVLGSPHSHSITFTPNSGNFEGASFNVNVTVGKKDQGAPSAPTVDSKTATSVTLIAISAATTVEYSISTVDGSAPTTWQTGLTFNNLLPNRTYTFFARLKEDDNHNASDPSTGTSATTEKATMVGKPTISGTTAFGHDLTASTTDLYAYELGSGSESRAALGAFTYKWQRVDVDGNNPAEIGTNAPVYTIGELDIGKRINVEVTAANANNPVISDNTEPVLKRTPVAGDFTVDKTSATYTGAAHVVGVTGKDGMGTTITVEYKLDDLGGEWGTTAPTNAGRYFIRVSVNEGTTYTEAINLPLDEKFDNGVFVIGKAVPTLDDLTVGLPGTKGQGSQDQNEDYYYIDWDENTPPTATIEWADDDEDDIGEIDVVYRVLGSTSDDDWTTAPPTSTGTFEIAAKIVGWTNYFDAIIVVGVIVVEGIPIDPDKITATGVDATYNREPHQVSVRDTEYDNSVIEYRTSTGAPWTATNPSFIDATTGGDITVHFRVTRPGTGYETYESSVTVRIAQRQLVWDVGSSGKPATANGRPYDGTATATPTTTNAPTLSVGSTNGVVAGDTVSVARDSLNFVDDSSNSVANAGTWDVMATGWDIEGDDAKNYIAPSQPTFAKATISKKQLTWAIGGSTGSAAAANDKLYDGTTTATVKTAPTLNGVVDGEDVTVATTGSLNFAQLGVGTGIAVNASGWGITGAAVGNYDAPTDEPLFSPANITALSIVGATVTVTSDYTYTGSAHTPGGSNITVTVTVGGTGKELAFGTEYEIVSYTNNINAGTETAEVKIRGVGNFGGEATGKFTIAQRGISGATVTVTREYTFSGSAHTPGVADMTVTVTIGGVGVTLVPGTDYEIDMSYETGGYNNNINAGTATVQIKGVGNFKDTATGNFTIAPQAISGTLTIAAVETSLDNGKIAENTEIKIDISSVVGVPPNGAVIAGTDITYQWYRNGVAIDGETGDTYIVKDTSTDKPLETVITAKVTGKGNFSGVLESNVIEIGKTSLSGSVSITGTPDLDKTLELDTSNMKPDGAKETNSFTITWLRNGVAIPKETSGAYVVKEDDLGKTLTVIVEGIDEYTGTLSDDIEIPAIAPYAPQNFTATAGNGQVALAWSAPSFDGGNAIIRYELLVDDGTWTDIGLVLSRTVTGLNNKQEYTFKVRAVNGATPGEGEPAEKKATPFAPPLVSSITPNGATAEFFAKISYEGGTFEAVFDVVGSDLTVAAVEGAFLVSAFPSWAVPSGGVSVDFDEAYDTVATVTVTLVVALSTEGARSGAVVLSNTITPAVTGTLAVSQVTAPSFLVTIVNAPNGGSVPVGQEPSSAKAVFQGARVSVSAGTRSGFVFGKWGSESAGVDVNGESGADLSFTMPGNPVVLTATWVEVVEPSPTPGPSPSPGPGPVVSPTPGVSPSPGVVVSPSPGADVVVVPTLEPGAGVSPSPGSGPGAGVVPSPGADLTPEPGIVPGVAPPEGDEGSARRGNGAWILLLLLALIAYVIIAIWWLWLRRKRRQDGELEDETGAEELGIRN